MIRDSVTQKGYVDLVLTDENGQVKEKRFVNNLVVQTGRNYIAHRMAGNGNVIMDHMRIGTTGTAAALTDVGLGNEVASILLSSATVSANSVVYVATFNAGTPAIATALTEAGIFNSLSGGEMLCRTTFSVINKEPADTLSITWTITNS